MKKRIWIGIAAIVVLAVGIGMIVTKVHANQDAAALDEQLRLARAEGIPTTWQEFAATIPAATPAENAAPLYRQLAAATADLKGKPSYDTDYSDLDAEVVFHTSTHVIKRAHTFLTDRKAVLELADRASKLPKCWFNRDWSQGFGTLFPEFAYMKGAAKAVAVRGALAAASHDPTAALADNREILLIGRHAGCEPFIISRLVGESVDWIAVRELSEWAFAFPAERAIYHDALVKAIAAMPRPDLKAEHSQDLSNILSLIDLSLTPEGRAKLGLHEDEVGLLNKIAPLLLSQPKARVEIVKAEREYWEALDQPPGKMGPLLEGAARRRDTALHAFPLADKLYEMFGSEDPTSNRKPNWETEIEACKAAARALSGPAIPNEIRTSDLLSPYDGKPLTYRFDGKQIVVTVSGNDPESRSPGLKIPSDKALAKPPAKAKQRG